MGGEILVICPMDPEDPSTNMNLLEVKFSGQGILSDILLGSENGIDMLIIQWSLVGDPDGI